MSKKRRKTKKFNPAKHVTKTVAMGSIESLGVGIPFSMAAGIPNATGRAIAGRAATTGTSLAGVATLTHASTGLIKQMQGLGELTKKRRK